MLSVPVGWCRILRSSISSIFPLVLDQGSHLSLWYNNEDDDDDEETKHIDNPPTTLPWHADCLFTCDLKKKSKTDRRTKNFPPDP